MNKIMWIVAAVVILGCMMSAPLLVSALDPGRLSADKETKARCQSDGGIHVYQKIGLEPGRFPTVIPDSKKTYDGTKHGMVYGKYRYEESYTITKSHGYFIYRHKTSIASVDDGNVVGEMVYYLRQGEPGLPGITCPENISNEKLLNAVFLGDNEVTEPFPACPTVTPPVVQLKPERSAQPHRSGVVITEGRLRDNDDWGKGMNCDEQTKIDRWYERSGTGSTSLTGTRLQFFGPTGNRCQSFAMPYSQHIICDNNGISVLGFKQTAGSPTLMLQRFSKIGQMVSEIEISNAAPDRGPIVSYRETANQIKINVANISNSIAKCYSVSVSKPDAISGDTQTRIGPQDVVFQLPECDTN